MHARDQWAELGDAFLFKPKKTLVRWAQMKRVDTLAALWSESECRKLIAAVNAMKPK